MKPASKRGKARASKSRLVLVLLVIERESGQSQGVEMQNQSNRKITLDTQPNRSINVSAVHKLYSKEKTEFSTEFKQLTTDVH